MRKLAIMSAIAVLHSVHLSYGKDILVQEGLPVAINCDVDFSKENAPLDSDEVECRIERDSTVAWNKTFTWNKRQDSELVFDADRNETVIVYVTRGNRTVRRSVTIDVQVPYKVCSTEMGCPSSQYHSYDIDDDIWLSLDLKENVADGIPKFKSEEVNFTIFKDCQKLKDLSFHHDYTTSEHSIYFELTTPSYSKTPGCYVVAAVYKKREYFFPRAIRAKKNLCLEVSPPRRLRNLPSIKSEQKLYEAAPGQNLTMTCTTSQRSAKKVGNVVTWFKYDKTFHSHRHEKYVNYHRCAPDPSLNVTEIRDKSGYVESKNTLRNVKVNDGGNYSCVLETSLGMVYDNFTVVIRTPASSVARPWVIAVIVIAVCSAIILLAVVSWHVLKREMRYFHKKYFAKPTAVSRKHSVAFLVYCGDVFGEDIDKNPLQDVITWLDEKDIPYTDPNKHCSAMTPEGNPYSNSTFQFNADAASDDINEVIHRSNCLIIILSKDLLTENEMEIFTSYMALNSNVESSQSVIFICTKEMKKIVFETGKFPGTECDQREQESVAKTITTFKNFMKRRENDVISWSPNKVSHFRKDLYVALPKVKTVKENQEDECVLVNSKVV